MPRFPTPKLLIIGDETVQVAIPRVRSKNFWLQLKTELFFKRSFVEKLG
jgi:hypothetical protein